MNKTDTKTAEVLAEMFTENTGRHGMDSGGAYGRHWERNTGLTVDDFLSLPSATWERDWQTTINAFHFLNERLTYSKTSEVLTRLLNVWELEDYDNRNPYHLSDQLEFLESLGVILTREGWNTYNWDNSLSQTLQGYEFSFGEKLFVLLQVHGGADVRGGYTRPKIFEACCDYWLHGCDSYTLTCNACETYWSVRGGEATDANGDWLRGYPNDLFRYGCTTCQGDLLAEAEECDY